MNKEDRDKLFGISSKKIIENLSSIIEKSMDEEASSIWNNPGTFSNEEPKSLTPEILQKAIELCNSYKLPPIPKRLYYIESKLVPIDAFFRFANYLDSLGFGRERIVVNPQTTPILKEVFGSMNIQLIPYVDPFSWCTKYRFENPLPMENYDEFWKELRNGVEKINRNIQEL